MSPRATWFAQDVAQADGEGGGRRDPERQARARPRHLSYCAAAAAAAAAAVAVAESFLIIVTYTPKRTPIILVVVWLLSTGGVLTEGMLLRTFRLRFLNHEL